MKKLELVFASSNRVAPARPSAEASGNIGSNFFLTDRHLSAKYKKGFDTAFSELSRIRASGARPSDSLFELDTVIGSDLFSLVDYITPDLQLQFQTLKEHLGVDSFALNQ